MSNAESFADWLQRAEEQDQLEGNEKWRATDESELYHTELLLQHTRQLIELQRPDQYENLVNLLQESLYRHLAEITNPALYAYAHAGTKHCITAFWDAAECAMEYLCNTNFPGLSKEEKLQGFELAFHNYGRSALLLSGGLAFGIYHTGVVKALVQQNLLPRIISGSSMGSIVAGAICSRNDAEVWELVHNPQLIHRRAVGWLSLKKILKGQGVLDPVQMKEHIDANVGDRTFAEAYAHSGRVLNISVSPTRLRQKPRILNYMTAPQVLVRSASLASCSIPGALPAVQLRRRDRKGIEAPYMETERWIDGSVHGDLPLDRLGRLHNVNHTIVSQANPHVLPFAGSHLNAGPLSVVRDLSTSMIRAQAAELLELSRSNWLRTPLRSTLDKARGVAQQTYVGDITIHFPFKPLMYRKVVANPGWKGLLEYIRLGEQATWPKIAMIRDQTCISFAFERCIALLKQEV